ncbi:MAG: DUF3299 domain-containing protein [Betaproteobacteria bacterium]
MRRSLNLPVTRGGRKLPGTVSPAVAPIIAALLLNMLSGGNAFAVAPEPGKVADEQLYSYIGTDPLPAGTVPWQVLRQVKLVEEKKGGKTTMRPEFSAQIRELDQQQVKVYGFVLPLSTTVKQKHFLISPLPTHCPFCVSQGPDSMIEVVARIPVEFSQWDPIVVSGKLELVNDSSLYYRLIDAESVKN